MHMQNLGADIKCIMIYVKMVNLKRGLSSNGFNYLHEEITTELQMRHNFEKRILSAPFTRTSF